MIDQWIQFFGETILIRLCQSPSNSRLLGSPFIKNQKANIKK